MGFNINDFLNEDSMKEIKSDWKPVRINISKIKPAPDKENFYHVDEEEIEQLARSIEMVGVQQYPVVKPIKGTGEYELIAGHKRRLAIQRLIDEGKNEFEMVPCKVEDTGDDIRNELILIFTNCTQRERTDPERMQEIKRVKKLIAEYQEEHGLAGRKQEIIAGILGTNKTKIGTLENIDRNLLGDFKNEFMAGKINTYTANEIAGLDIEAQKSLYETYLKTGTIKAADAKEMKAESTDQEVQLPGQTTIDDYISRVPDREECIYDKSLPCTIKGAYEVARGGLGIECPGTCCYACKLECGARCNHSTSENYKHSQMTEQIESTDYVDAEPDKIESRCYSCFYWSGCDQKGNNVSKCNKYLNKAEKEKTEEQRYSEQQDEIDKETAKKLKEMEEEDAMSKIPSSQKNKEYKVKLAAVSYDEVKNGVRKFELLKDEGYKVGDILLMQEYKQGEETGRVIKTVVEYVMEERTGLSEGYCILGIKVDSCMESSRKE